MAHSNYAASTEEIRLITRVAYLYYQQGQKQSQILEAEGRREAAFRDAEAREREAEAEAKATEMVSNAIAGGNAQAINYFVAQKYVDAMHAFANAPNAKTIFMPLEATSLVGTIGGIGELVKAVKGDGDTPPPAPAPRPRRPGPFEQV